MPYMDIRYDDEFHNIAAEAIKKAEIFGGRPKVEKAIKYAHQLITCDPLIVEALFQHRGKMLQEKG